MSERIERIERFQPGEYPFSASRKAEEWLREKGWSYGSMQRDQPRGVYRGDAIIAKWRNLSKADRKNLDGEIRYPCRDAVEGRVEIWMRGD